MRHYSIEQYNRILGIQNVRSIEHLKRVYRMRAKHLHPDRNTDARSHEQFVLLHEAYEYYVQKLTGGCEVFSEKHKSKQRNSGVDINEEKRNQARSRAAERARMKNVDFQRKGYFRILNKLFYIFMILRVVQALALLIVLPVFIFYQDGFRGLISVLVVQCLTYPAWSPYIKIIFRPQH